MATKKEITKEEAEEAAKAAEAIAADEANKKQASNVKRKYTLLVDAGQHKAGDIVELTADEAAFHGEAIVKGVE